MRVSLVLVAMAALLAVPSAPSHAIEEVLACDPAGSEEMSALMEATRAKVRKQARFCADIDISALDQVAFEPQMDADGSDTLQVGAVSLRPSDGSFSVTLVRMDSATEATPIRVVRGRYYQSQPVIVASQRIDVGSVIGPEDITVIRIAPEDAPQRAATRMEDVVGMAARWTIPPRTVVTASQVQPHFVVRKGNRLMAVFQGPNVALSTEAVAAENGALGQMISLKNMTSNRVIQARVRDANTAIVQ